jgi:photosystem II stability/assembly factor-like uncharacterized protein
MVVGIGVQISTDRGRNWTTLTRDFGGSSDFEFNPENPRTIYAINGGGGGPEPFYKSTDFGKTWVQKKILGSPEIGVGQIEVDPSRGNTLYAQLGNGVIFKSTNAGESWRRSDSGLRAVVIGMRGLTLDRFNPQILYSAGFEGIYKTTNGGQNWFSTNCKCRVRRIAIDPQNNQNLYAVGRGDNPAYPQAVKSSDGGRTWSRLPLPYFRFHPYLTIAISPFNQKLMLASSGERGIFRTTDTGQSWQLQSKRIADLGTYVIEPDRNRPGHLITTAGSSGRGRLEPALVFETFNYGKQWRTVPVLDSIDGGYVKIHPRSSNFIIVGGQKLGASSDGGRSWAIRDYPGAELAFDPGDPSTIYTVSDYFFKSTNLGITWTNLTPALLNYEFPIAFDVSSQNGNIIFLGTQCSPDDDCSGAAKILRSNDGGKSWTNVTANGLPRTGAFFEVHIDPKNSSFAYVIGDGLYKTNNSGATWRRLVNFPPDGMYLIIDDRNPKQLYCQRLHSGNGSIYSSSDGGQTWRPFSMKGLKFAGALTVSPWNSNTLYATYNGVVHTFTKK